jgi:hypothetical protein
MHIKFSLNSFAFSLRRDFEPGSFVPKTEAVATLQSIQIFSNFVLHTEYTKTPYVDDGPTLEWINVEWKNICHRFIFQDANLSTINVV